MQNNTNTRYHYQILKEYLVDKIRSGEYSNNRRIASELNLCRQFNLARNTVRQAIKELVSEGYLYSVQGKGTFVRNTTPDHLKKIALLIYDTTYMTHPVTANLIRGIDAILQQHQYALDIFASRREFGVDSILKLSDEYAGFLIGAYQLDRPTLAELEKSGRPFLFVKNYLPDYQAQAIKIDFCHAGFGGAQHLIQQGCRDLGLIYAGDSCAISTDFGNGVKQACLEYGVCLKQKNIVINDPTAAFNPQMLEPMGIKLPDGIICFTDDCAVALCEELYRRGLHIPQDIRVMGCNNTRNNPRGLPQLTTINIPTYELGQYAAENLLKLIHGETRATYKPLLPQLIVKEST